MIYNKKKVLTISVLGTLAFSLLITGVYLFVKNDFKRDIVLDKYKEISEFCIKEEKDKSVTFTCDALLVDITNEKEKEGCVQAIIYKLGKGKQLINICENEESLNLTNEMFSIKKLSPVTISFDYQTTDSKNYTYKGISTKTKDSKYVQGIVNDDITSLLTMENKPTLLKNSFDFCPSPSIVPEYVTMKKEYSEYFNKNILTKKYYDNFSLLPVEDSLLEEMFDCMSAKNLEYDGICTKDSKISILEGIPHISFDEARVQWNKELSISDTSSLKYISYIYDSLYNIKGSDVNLVNTYKSVGDNLATPDTVNSMVVCSMYPIYSELAKKNKEYSQDLNAISSLLENNIEKNFSSLCSGVLPTYSKEGKYILQYLNSNNDSNVQTDVLNRCLNLTNIFE